LENRNKGKEKISLKKKKIDYQAHSELLSKKEYEN
jgi:hypothetical protein